MKMEEKKEKMVKIFFGWADSITLWPEGRINRREKRESQEKRKKVRKLLAFCFKFLRFFGERAKIDRLNKKIKIVK